MGVIEVNGKSYSIDTEGFLSNYRDWDENFALGQASKAGIGDGLADDHWQVIHFIRRSYDRTGKCPLVFETCRAHRLSLQDLKRLFPSGYLRGACKLAGISYKEGYFDQSGLEEFAERIASPVRDPEKTYVIDSRGFLANAADWDEGFAMLKAVELKMPKLSDKHWRVIHFLRAGFGRDHRVPTIYETCEANGIELDELEKLFPDGYHRGAVKVAGLRVR